MSRKNTLAGSLAGLKQAQTQGAPKAAKSTGAPASVITGARGKSADNRFLGTTVYLTKQTHAQAKAALLTDNADAETAEDKRDLSDLIESLLVDWLAARKG